MMAQQIAVIRFIGHRELIGGALNIARDHGLTVCDGLFFALAKTRRAALITADERLAKAFEAQRG